MAFDNRKLIIEHHCEKIDDDDMYNYIAHIICTQGKIAFDFNGNSFVLNKGEAMILTLLNKIENINKSSDFEPKCIYIQPEFIERCTPRNNYGIKGTLALYQNPIMQMDEFYFKRLLLDFTQIEERLNDKDNDFQEDTLISVTQLLFLDFFHIHAQRNGLANISFQDSDIIARFMQMLEHGDYIKNREISYYADKLCVTPKYLSEVCKNVSGKTANYWITRFTTIHIRRLLQDREMSFTDISNYFKFSSPAYFSRFVQKNLGTSPSHFRE